MACGQDLQAPRCVGRPERLEAALQVDRDRTRRWLRDLVLRPVVREAIYLASPDLAAAVEGWLDGRGNSGGWRIERSLMRYVQRMAGRPTPFGLFAGCTVGRIAERSRLTLPGHSGYRRQSRFDMQYLCGLARAVAVDPRVRVHLPVRPNQSLYRWADAWRYVEVRVASGSVERMYHLVSARADDALDATLERASAGAPPAALAKALTGDDVTLEEAEAYVEELMVGQILVPALEPGVTGTAPDRDLIDQLSRHESTWEMGRSLEAGCHLLDVMDSDGIGISPGRYREIMERLETLPFKGEASRLFQVDLFKPAPDATLGADVVGEIVRGVEILHRMWQPPQEDELSRFREAFEQRYGDAEVPLLEALDEESGVGFSFFDRPPGKADPSVTWGCREQALLRHLDAAIRGNRLEITLQQSDLRELETAHPPELPHAFYAKATLAAPSPEALDQGRFQVFLNHADGPSGALLLSRFCHGDDTLRQWVLSHIRDEAAQRPDAVLAEIVHLPQDRHGNFICRPLLREYDILCLGRSGLPESRQIRLTELYVHLEGTRVVLRSHRLGAEVVPRLTNAHNTRIADLGIYRFLTSLTRQGVADRLAFRWGPLQSARFLPRVRVGRTLLSLARWRLTRPELEPLARLNGAKLFLAVQLLRQRFSMPRRVAVAENGSHDFLAFDLDGVLSVETLVHLIRGREEVVLTELWPDPEDLCVRGPEGRFTHELVVPFIRTRATGGTDPSPLPMHQVPRTAFPPGSEWLYLKLYTGTETADEVLCEGVRPVVDHLLESGSSDRWFFTRHGDPDSHLRLCIHGSPDRLQAEALPALLEAVRPFLEERLIWRLQVDTYRPEVRRCGGEHALGYVERIFFADTQAVLRIIEGVPDADTRWRLALMGMDRLLDDFGFDARTRCKITRDLRDEGRRQPGTDPAARHRVAEQFRKERDSLRALLDRDPTDETVEIGMAPFQVRSQCISPAAGELRQLEGSQRLTVPLASVAGHLIQMHANRIFSENASAHAVVMYDLLSRLYDTRSRRAGASSHGP